MKKNLSLAAATAVILATACTPQPVEYSVEVAPYWGDKDCAVSFTYDDGMLCHYTDIAPELEKRGFRATFWIIGQNMGKDDPGYPWMNWDQVRDLSERGHEISNHTWTHPSLPQLTPEQLEDEIVRCDTVIERVTGRKPTTFCYPYNAMSPEVVAQCSQDRVGTRTFQDGHGQRESHCTASSLTQWLDSLIAQREWGVTMTHGTTYGWDMWDDPQVLYAFYDEVKAQEERVWVATFAEVAAYREEQRQLQVTAEGDTRHCVVKGQSPLDAQLFCQPVTLRLSGYDWAGRQVKARQCGQEVAVVLRDGVLLVDYVPGQDDLVIEW